MAEKKKNTKKSTAKKDTKAKQSAKQETKAKQSAKQEKIDKLELKAKQRQTVAAVIFCVSLFMLVVAVFKGGIDSAYNKYHNFHMGFWGFGAYIVPFILIVFAVMLSKNENKKKSIRFLALALILTVSVQALWLLIVSGFESNITFKDIVSAEFGKETTHGGMFGAMLGGMFYVLTHSKGASIAIVAVILLTCILFISRTTIATLFKPVEKTGKVVKEKGTEQIKKQSQNIFEKRERQKQERIERERAEAEAAAERLREYEERKKKQQFDDFSAMGIDVEAAFNEAIGLRTLVDKDKKPIEQKPPVDTVSTDEENITDDFDNIENVDDSYSDLINELEPPFIQSSLSLDELVEQVALKSEENIPSQDDGFENIEAKPKKKKLENADDEIAEFENDILENEQEIKVYEKPSFDLLTPPSGGGMKTTRDELKENGEKLIAALNSYGVEASILDIVPAPAVTRYELSPAAGVKIKQITNLADDLSLHLAAVGGIRMEAPIPGKAAIGVEIPNREKGTITLRECLESTEFAKSKGKLSVVLGKNIAGSVIVANLAKMPHLLVAGTTGSGKSVCLNAMILSILFNATPDEVKLILIDPKTVEFSVYNNIPHLLVPVVNDPRKAAGALCWAVTEMLNRYKILNGNNVRDLDEYNRLCDTNPELTKIPKIVIFIDELSDLMMVAPAEVNESIKRLAQMARAAGIHLVLATQRPSVDVITGVIKANIPSRIALSVASQVDSRTIIDVAGAEKLLGYGDMLYWPSNVRQPMRVQGCYMSSAEISRVIDFIKKQGETAYDESIQEEIESQIIPEKKKETVEGKIMNKDAEDEEIIEEAIKFFAENPQSCTGSAFQRRFGFGFQRAGRILDIMERRGYIGPIQGSKPRELLITPTQYLQQKATSELEEEEE